LEFEGLVWLLEVLLRSKAEVRVLGVVLFSDGLHLREIARAARVSPSEAKRELDSLSTLGVLRREKKGGLSFYEKNELSPILPELTSLYLKTEGAVATVKTAVEGVLKKKGFENSVEFAFVYGSYANRSFTEKSDLDLLVVGGIAEEELANALLKAQEKIGRPINFVLWSEKDFLQKLREKTSFIKNVTNGDKIWVWGDENGFKRIVKKTLG